VTNGGVLAGARKQVLERGEKLSEPQMIKKRTGAKMAAGALQADGSTLAEPTISAEHVAEAILYMVRLPLDANVLSMTVMATGMPFAGRG
jgi:NADP-dependent 3-hydroxy acid dehydrogenase YdfG